MNYNSITELALSGQSSSFKKELDKLDIGDRHLILLNIIDNNDINNTNVRKSLSLFRADLNFIRRNGRAKTKQELRDDALESLGID